MLERERVGAGRREHPHGARPALRRAVARADRADRGHGHRRDRGRVPRAARSPLRLLVARQPDRAPGRADDGARLDGEAAADAARGRRGDGRRGRAHRRRGPCGIRRRRELRETPVYEGLALGAGARLDGPAIVELANTTIVVLAGVPALRRRLRLVRAGRRRGARARRGGHRARRCARDALRRHRHRSARARHRREPRPRGLPGARARPRPEAAAAGGARRRRGGRLGGRSSRRDRTRSS